MVRSLPGIADGLVGAAAMGHHDAGVMDGVRPPFPRHRERPGIAPWSRRPGVAGRTSEPLWPRGAAFAGWTLQASLAGLARLALWAGGTGGTWAAIGASRPRRTLHTCRTGRTGLARCTGLAIAAIADLRQPVGDLTLERREPLGKVGPQSSNCRLRLCLDELALALPLFAFLRDLALDAAGNGPEFVG
jgi:hypothetical protein